MKDEAIPEIGTELFKSLKVNVPAQYLELTLEVWTPTPWIVNVQIKDREQQIVNWCNAMVGHGRWHQSNVTMMGYRWFGFASESLMNTFMKKFPSPPRK